MFTGLFPRARACASQRLGGSLFQFPTLALGRNAFSGSLFPVLLRMNAEIAP